MNADEVLDSRLQTVTSYLAWDHERLGRILEQVRKAVLEGHPEQARERYQDFQEGLKRHIGLEEGALFPAFEGITGVSWGPTEAMRREHRLIEQALAQVHDSLQDWRLDDAAKDLERLEGLLRGHDRKEECVLYPMIDRALPNPQRASLLAELQGSGC